MFAKMGSLCVVSLESINRFLVGCFKLIDQEESFRQKINFESSHQIIGREYEHIVYLGASYLYLKDENTKDIIYSDLINIASRPKNMLSPKSNFARFPWRFWEYYQSSSDFC